MKKKIKYSILETDVCRSKDEKPSLVLAQCKENLMEIFGLLERIRKVNPSALAKAMANLSQEEKAVLSRFARQGEIRLKLEEIYRKDPKYIS